MKSAGGSSLRFFSPMVSLRSTTLLTDRFAESFAGLTRAFRPDYAPILLVGSVANFLAKRTKTILRYYRTASGRKSSPDSNISTSKAWSAEQSLYRRIQLADSRQRDYSRFLSSFLLRVFKLRFCLYLSGHPVCKTALSLHAVDRIFIEFGVTSWWHGVIGNVFSIRRLEGNNVSYRITRYIHHTL